jgi:SAM-dependent methyltransferase
MRVSTPAFPFGQLDGPGPRQPYNKSEPPGSMITSKGVTELPTNGPSDAQANKDISQKNQLFWNELCGTQFARSLGVTDSSPASLKRFDDWYFMFYPYLPVHIPFDEITGKRVLEVGLGYGTVSQRIAESGANYSGLDIAEGPVAMVNNRLDQAGLGGTAIQGSILRAPFPDGYFDLVIAIGCLHHTGNLQMALDECRRLLVPGGRLVLMVYYAYSYRRLFQASRETLVYARREMLGYRGVVGQSASVERAAYDTNETGDAAPHTDWISIRSLRKMCQDFSAFSAKLENIDNGRPFERFPSRRELLKRWYPRWFGLDLYATATK